MVDPPRPAAISAVAACRHAGLDVKMITGDHASTASTIARQVGLPDGGVLTGRDLDRLEDAQLHVAVSSTSVFARVVPAHKLHIVAALRRRGHVLILVAVLAFPITGGEALLPASPVQILWINLVAAVTLALPLAFEAMEPGLMRRAPRPSDEPLLSRFVVTRTVGVALLMTGAAIALFLHHRRGRLDDGAGESVALAEAQTVVVTMIVLFQLLYLLQSRTRTRPVREIGWTTNPSVFAGIAVLLALHVCFVYLPVMHDLFGSASLDAAARAEAGAAALVVVPAVAAEKRWRRRRQATERHGWRLRPVKAGDELV
jgi:magnesium-transporting ATPase (P-type)